MGMIAALTDKLPTWFERLNFVGPIFARELMVASRQKKNYALRMAYVAIMTLVVMIVWFSAVNVFEVGTLQPYQTATLTFRVIVDYAERGYAITNVALVNSDQQGIPIRTPFTTVPVYHYLYIPMVIRDPE